MTAIEASDWGAHVPFDPDDPDGIDDLAARLIELHEVATPHRGRSRLCACERPLALADGWFGPAWVRCLHCGHDIPSSVGVDPEVVQEMVELAAIVREQSPVAWERVAGDLVPYFPDDPATSAFTDDGRLEDGE